MVVRNKTLKNKKKQKRNSKKIQKGGLLSWFTSDENGKVKIVEKYCQKIGGYTVYRAKGKDGIRCFSRKDRMTQLKKEFKKKFGPRSYQNYGIKLKYIK